MGHERAAATSGFTPNYTRLAYKGPGGQRFGFPRVVRPFLGLLATRIARSFLRALA